MEMREKFGDVEVFDAQRDKAEFFARIGDKTNALKAYDDVAGKGLSTGQKIDVAIAKVGARARGCQPASRRPTAPTHPSVTPPSGGPPAPADPPGDRAA